MFGKAATIIAMHNLSAGQGANRVNPEDPGLPEEGFFHRLFKRWSDWRVSSATDRAPLEAAARRLP